VAVRRVTLKQVAELAGVSGTTASFVLSGRRDMRIAPDTARRVFDAARHLNYRPYLAARSLTGHSSGTIGFISDTVATDTFAGQIIQGCLTTALLKDHLLLIGETQGNPHLERQLIRAMQDRGVTSFLYASMFTRAVTVPADLRDGPLVLVNCFHDHHPATAVIPDERDGGRTAAGRLLADGHTDRIYLVGETPDHVWAAEQRRFGIDEALATAGQHVAGIVDCRWWPEAAHAAVSDFLVAHPGRPTAFICLNDRVAWGTYQAVHEAGLTVPDDVSVISFDDSDLAEWVRPGLTSVGLPHFELGRTATETLLKLPAGPPSVRTLLMPLAERSSVAPASPRSRTPTRKHRRA